MDITAINAETGEKFTVENRSIDEKFIKWANSVDMPDSSVSRIIDNLDVSADVKSALFSITKATIKVGGYIVSIGRKILDCIIAAFKEFPTAGFGIIFGAILGVLVTAIPVIGALLGGLVTPVLMALGMIGGMKEDLKDKVLERKIAEINGKFSPLKA